MCSELAILCITKLSYLFLTFLVWRAAWLSYKWPWALSLIAGIAGCTWSRC